MSRKMLVTSACFMLTSAALVIAAQNAEPNRAQNAQNTDANRAAQSATQGSQFRSNVKSADHLFANCVALANQEEMALAQIAREKASHDDVKEFAEKMTTDHHAFLMKLKKYAPEATQENYIDSTARTAKAGAKAEAENKSVIVQTSATDADKDAEDRNTATQAERDAAPRTAADQTNRTGNNANRDFNHLQVERELAMECLKGAKEKLNEASGEEFDKCFIGMQIAMHMGMKAKLAVFQRHASPELAAILAEGEKTTKEHLARAEDIMERLASDKTTSTTEKVKEGPKKEKRVIKEKTTTDE